MGIPAPRMRPPAAEVEPRHLGPRPRPPERRAHPVRAQPVERSVGPGEHPVEVLGRGQRRQRRALLEREPHPVEPVERDSLALLRLLRVWGGSRPRRAVHDDLEPLGAVGRAGRVAVLGVEVEGRVARHEPPLDVGELRLALAAEVDVVADRRVPPGASGEGPDVGRQAAPRHRGLGHHVGERGAQQTLPQRARVAIEHYPRRPRSRRPPRSAPRRRGRGARRSRSPRSRAGRSRRTPRPCAASRGPARASHPRRSRRPGSRRTR